MLLRSMFNLARKLRVIVSLLLAVAALGLVLQSGPAAHAASHTAGAAHDSHAPQAARATNGNASVTAAYPAFDPNVVTITAGSSVVWTNADTFAHTTTSNDNVWNDPLGPGEVVTETFTAPGIYDYHCQIHSIMTGRVVVLPASPNPPAAVSIAGPFEGAINTTYTFTATVSPITATPPITYFWQATGQSPITHGGGDLSDTIMFTWTSGTTGTQWITATATNQGGTATGTHVIIFNPKRVYLPLIFR